MGIRLGIFKRHLHHRVVFQPRQAAARALRVTPARPRDELPARAEHVRPLLEYHRARHPQVLGQGGVVLEADAPLGMGEVTGSGYEAFKLGVGDRMHIDPEIRHASRMGRAFFVVEAVRAKAERAAWHAHQAVTPGALACCGQATVAVAQQHRRRGFWPGAVAHGEQAGGDQCAAGYSGNHGLLATVGVAGLAGLAGWPSASIAILLRCAYAFQSRSMLATCSG